MKKMEVIKKTGSQEASQKDDSITFRAAEKLRSNMSAKTKPQSNDGIPAQRFLAYESKQNRLRWKSVAEWIG